MTDETLLQQGTNTCRKARSSDTGFNLSEAKRKLVALQNKVVSQHDSTTNLHDDRLEGKSLSDVLMVEIYAGSARLARACRHVGCRSVAVDKTTDRSHGTKILFVM